MSLNDRIIAGEMAKWDVYFKRMGSLGELYDSYDDALEEFNYLDDKMTEDFCLPMAIAGGYVDGCKKFKLLAKEEDGWVVLMCNAMFAFGDQPCIMKMVDPKESGNA